MTGDHGADGRAFLPFPLQGLVPAELLGLGTVRVRRLPAAMLPRILPEAT